MKINEIINELTPETQMILLNVFYFKELWENKLNYTTTELKSFYNLNKEEDKINAMKKLKKFKYYEDLNFQAI